jgi:hypothetical protein
MTSFKLGDAPFVKHVGSTTIFVRSNMVICHQIKKELKCFRSFKNFDQEKFTEDLNRIHFDKIIDQNDVNKMLTFPVTLSFTFIIFIMQLSFFVYSLS